MYINLNGDLRKEMNRMSEEENKSEKKELAAFEKKSRLYPEPENPNLRPIGAQPLKEPPVDQKSPDDKPISKPDTNKEE